MKPARPFFHRSLIIMVLIVLSGIFAQPAPSFAQDPDREQTTTPVAQTDATQPLELSGGERVSTEPTLVPTPTESVPTVESPATTEELLADFVPPTVVQRPSATTVLTRQMELNISVQDTVRASELITYQYTYKNNASTATSNLFIDVVWLSFSPTSDGGSVQWCPPGAPNIQNCGFIIDSVEGPAVTFDSSTTIPNGYRFKIANLQPGQSGSFKFRLKINNSTYPITINPPVNSNGTIRRPSGSARLFVDGDPKPLEATATSLIIGPVFTLTKVAQQNKILYPLETGTFTITLGNATGSGDVTNGVRRVDARDATNVILRDKLPDDADLVSSSVAYEYDAQTRYIRWTFPTLAVGQQRQIVVVFRKRNEAINCNTLENSDYGVTSSEVPRDKSNNIQYVNGAKASYSVRTPFDITNVSFSPNLAPYGSEGTYSFKIFSYWDQPITGLKIRVTLPPEQTYIQGSAVPGNPTTVPIVGNPGGTLIWTIDVPATTQRNVAVERTFSFKVNLGFSNPTDGFVDIVLPDGLSIPMACVPSRAFKRTPDARIVLSLSSPETEGKLSDTQYYVQRGQSFRYDINVQNRGNTNAVLDKVRAGLPIELGALFAYKNGTGKIGTTPSEPTIVQSGGRTYLEWYNVSVPANSNVHVYFTLIVNGRDYQWYCTNPFGTIGQENVTTQAPDRVCVKINPNIDMTKTTESTVVREGDIVEFILTWTNNESSDYPLTPVDFLDQFIFVSQSSNLSYALENNGKYVVWEQVTLAPGQTLQITLRARVPETATCTPRTLVNELRFRTTDGGEIVSVPRTFDSVQVVCNILRYNVVFERSPVSLNDYFWYEITIQNVDSTAESGTVSITDVLPLNFRFSAMHPQSNVQTAPTSATGTDGRVRLYWTLPPIGPSRTIKVRFWVRSGLVAEANIKNYVYISQTKGESVCNSNCTTVLIDNVNTPVAFTQVTTEALITLDPTATPTTCMKPGDTVTYRINITNRNSAHGYTDTRLTLTLPPGVTYLSSTAGRQAPDYTTPNAEGGTDVVWNKLNILKNPSANNASPGYVVTLEIQFKVGNVWGDVVPTMLATSTYGAIPERDPNVRPTIKVCPTSPAMAKTVNRSMIRVGESVIYQITLANPNASSITATVQDVLPAGMSFDGMVSGATPTQNGNTLTWNVTIPAATQQGGVGIVTLRFRAKLNQGNRGQKIENVATVTQSSVPITTTSDGTPNGTPLNKATTTVAIPVFLPLVLR